MSKRGIDSGKVDELKIDKDCMTDREWVNDYVDLIVSVCKSYGVRVLSIRKCLSKRKGAHYYVKIDPPVDSALANRIQWLLGDDCQRVDFNRARIQVGYEAWNKLFELPNKRLRTIYRCSASSEPTCQARQSFTRSAQHEHKNCQHRGRS